MVKYKYIVLTADNKFDGRVYDADKFTVDVYDHHDQYGECVCKVAVADVPVGDIDNPADVLEYGAMRTAALQDRLWRAAKAYQLDQLDDAGYYEMSKKAATGGVKAQANVNWVVGIWNAYYIRKTSNTKNFDFSSCGNLPYSFYEAREE